MTWRVPGLRAAALACVAVLACSTAVACSDDSTDSAPAPASQGRSLPGDFSGSGPGTLQTASTLPTVDRRLIAATTVAARITYASTSGIDGSATSVSGTVFAPKGTPPDGGWPVVAYGHPTTGIHTECAPSLSSDLSGISSVVSELIKAGYVVTVPDYQGLGTSGTYHPYLDATTVGQNMIDAVRAARKLVPDTSDRWMAVGISQGGQAAWAANELSSTYGAGLSLQGAVSAAPPLEITGFADAVADGTLSKDQIPPYAFILASLAKERPGFDLDDYRRGIAQEKWDVLTACDGPAAGEVSGVVDQVTPDDLRPSSPAAVDELRGYLQRAGLPQRPTTAPTLVIYGGRDALIPPAWTDRALQAACRQGDVLDVQFQPDRGHDDIDASAAYPWINERFRGNPAPNSCESLLAASEVPAEGAEGFTEVPAEGQGETATGTGELPVGPSDVRPAA